MQLQIDSIQIYCKGDEDNIDRYLTDISDIDKDNTIKYVESGSNILIKRMY